MDPLYILCAAVAFLVPGATIAAVIVRLRRRRKFAFFRVVDEKTGAPLADAAVFLLKGNTTRAFVSNGTVHQGLTMEGGMTRVGQLDAQGTFRRVFGAGDGALAVKGGGLNGVVGLESVSHYEDFPSEPYVCPIRMGMIAPPTKRSPLTYGLGPGQTPTVRDGYLTFGEKPEVGEVYMCWPTPDEARAADMSAGMSRMWKLRGSEAGPTNMGTSFFLAADSVERAD